MLFSESLIALEEDKVPDLSESKKDKSDKESEESKDGSESVVKTDNAQFQVSEEKWNIILGNSLLTNSGHKKRPLEERQGRVGAQLIAVVDFNFS
jgi:hypothetical protein